MSFEKTMEMVNFLIQHDKVLDVYYPLIANGGIDTLNKTKSIIDRNKELVQLYFKQYGPTLLTFVINMEKNDAKEWMQSFKNIKFKTSFGSAETKLDPWPIKLKSKTLCRLSIGYDSNIDIIKEEFNMKLNKI